jgi:hypothetical protein
MKISRQCLLILSENKETGAKVVISKGREKKARSHGAPPSHAFESLFPDFLLLFRGSVMAPHRRGPSFRVKTMVKAINGRCCGEEVAK